MRSGDVNECIVDINRNIKTKEQILADTMMTDEQKNIELIKLDVGADLYERYNIKFAPIFSGHSSL